jgi:hypothetical protein
MLIVMAVLRQVGFGWMPLELQLSLGVVRLGVILRVKEGTRARVNPALLAALRGRGGL